VSKAKSDVRALTTREAAAYLGVAEITLKIWRMHGVGPRYLRYNSKCVRYRLDDLAAFERACEVTTRRTAKAGLRR
jgi:hypothetical protein